MSEVRAAALATARAEYEGLRGKTIAAMQSPMVPVSVRDMLRQLLAVIGLMLALMEVEDGKA